MVKCPCVVYEIGKKLLVLLFVLLPDSRSSDLIIGITNTPVVQPDEPVNYSVCAIYPCMMAIGANTTLQCRDDIHPGRYLFVMHAHTNDYLVLCEVRVYT